VEVVGGSSGLNVLGSFLAGPAHQLGDHLAAAISPADVDPLDVHLLELVEAIINRGEAAALL
jgi:hypothetical protein